MPATRRSSVYGHIAAFTPFHRGGTGPPLVLIHGFVDCWRTWDLVLPHLERHHDVLAPALVGHAGGPPLHGEVTRDLLPDALERAMDEAGFETAHIAGNSLGGYLALQLAARGRARSVVALAPGGGWAQGDDSYRETLDFFPGFHEQVKAIAPHADRLLASPEGKRRATLYTTVNYEHVPSELLAHQTRAVAACDGVVAMSEFARREGYRLDAEKITCPVRIAWGTEDRLLPWPAAARRYLDDWLPHADWVVLDGVGHSPQLDVPLETAQLILGFTQHSEPRASRVGTRQAASRSGGAWRPPAASRMSGDSKSRSAAVRSARLALPANWCW
jgi:pimeloyl-ACP methyl ester carboxylesterase